jgi:hypothetical protein
MSLREYAASTRSDHLADPMGTAEDIVYITAAGFETPGRGVWLEYPSDIRDGQGIGVEAGVSRAYVDISEALAPLLTRADSFRRVKTGVTWTIEQIDNLAGVGYHVTLSQPGEGNLRGTR